MPTSDDCQKLKEESTSPRICIHTDPQKLVVNEYLKSWPKFEKKSAAKRRAMRSQLSSTSTPQAPRSSPRVALGNANSHSSPRVLALKKQDSKTGSRGSTSSLGNGTSSAIGSRGKRNSQGNGMKTVGSQGNTKNDHESIANVVSSQGNTKSHECSANDVGSQGNANSHGTSLPSLTPTHYPRPPQQPRGVGQQSSAQTWKSAHRKFSSVVKARRLVSSSSGGTPSLYRPRPPSGDNPTPTTQTRSVFQRRIHSVLQAKQVAENMSGGFPPPPVDTSYAGSVGRKLAGIVKAKKVARATHQEGTFSKRPRKLFKIRQAVAQVRTILHPEKSFKRRKSLGQEDDSEEEDWENKGVNEVLRQIMERDTRPLLFESKVRLREGRLAEMTESAKTVEYLAGRSQDRWKHVEPWRTKYEKHSLEWDEKRKAVAALGFVTFRSRDTRLLPRHERRDSFVSERYEGNSSDSGSQDNSPSRLSVHSTTPSTSSASASSESEAPSTSNNLSRRDALLRPHVPRRKPVTLSETLKKRLALYLQPKKPPDTPLVPWRGAERPRNLPSRGNPAFSSRLDPLQISNSLLKCREKLETKERIEDLAKRSEPVFEDEKQLHKLGPFLTNGIHFSAARWHPDSSFSSSLRDPALHPREVMEAHQRELKRIAISSARARQQGAFSEEDDDRSHGGDDGTGFLSERSERPAREGSSRRYLAPKLSLSRKGLPKGVGLWRDSFHRSNSSHSSRGRRDGSSSSHHPSKSSAGPGKHRKHRASTPPSIPH